MQHNSKASFFWGQRLDLAFFYELLVVSRRVVKAINALVFSTFSLLSRDIWLELGGKKWKEEEKSSWGKTVEEKLSTTFDHPAADDQKKVRA